MVIPRTRFGYSTFEGNHAPRLFQERPERIILAGTENGDGMTFTRTLTSRQLKALIALESKDMLLYHDLPTFVGRGTMAEMVAMGFAEVVPESGGAYSKNHAWRLAK